MNFLFYLCFFSSLGSKTLLLKYCPFVALRNSYLHDEKQNTVCVCVCVCVYLSVCLVLKGLTTIVETLFFVACSVLILLSQKNVTFNCSAVVSTYPLVFE